MVTKKDPNDPCENCKHLTESDIVAQEPKTCYFCGAPDYGCWEAGN